MQRSLQRNYLTTNELAERWKRTPRTLQRYRSDPTHPLIFDFDSQPTHPTIGKGYSLALIERIERSWGAR